MKPLYKKITSTALLLILVALALYYISQNISAFKKLTIASPGLIFFMVFIFLFSYFCVAMYTRSLLVPFKIPMKVGESFMLSIVTGFYNLITPFRGGMVARATYLKKKHKFSFTDFLATLAGMYVIAFLISGLIGLFSSWWIFNKTGSFNLVLIGIFSVIVLGMLFIILFSKFFPELKGRWFGKVSRVVHGWNLIKNNPRVIFSVGLFSLLQLLLTALMLNLQFRVFGIEIPYIGTLVLASITSLSLLVSITPANLGINEAIIVFSATTLGITPAESLAAALLGRAVQTIVLFILGPIFSWILLKKNPREVIVNSK